MAMKGERSVIVEDKGLEVSVMGWWPTDDVT